MDWVQWLTAGITLLLILGAVSGALKSQENVWSILLFLLIILIPFMRVLGFI